MGFLHITFEEPLENKPWRCLHKALAWKRERFSHCKTLPTPDGSNVRFMSANQQILFPWWDKTHKHTHTKSVRCIWGEKIHSGFTFCLKIQETQINQQPETKTHWKLLNTLLMSKPSVYWHSCQNFQLYIFSIYTFFYFWRPAKMDESFKSSIKWSEMFTKTEDFRLKRLHQYIWISICSHLNKLQSVFLSFFTRNNLNFSQSIFSNGLEFTFVVFKTFLKLIKIFSNQRQTFFIIFQDCSVH